MKVESFTYPQNIDGSIWKIYKLGSGVVMLTSRGLGIKDGHLLRLISKYRQDKVKCKLSDTRIPFSKGGNSQVFKLNGSEILVKEGSDRHSLVAAVERMDKLKYVIESGNVPRWIDLPEHYGVVEFINRSGQRETFSFMQQVDDGVTLEDVLSDPSTLSYDKGLRVARNIGKLTPAEKAEIVQGYEELKTIIPNAIEVARNLHPDEFPAQMLPDLHEGNILVERQQTPVSGKNFKFWLIDQ